MEYKYSPVKQRNFSATYIKFSVFSFLLALGTIVVYLNVENHWRALLYLLILFVLTFIPGLILSRRYQSPWIVLFINPALVFSIDAFFLRLGLFNYFVYLEKSWHPALTQDILYKAAALALLGNLLLWAGYFLPLSYMVGSYVKKYVQHWSRTKVVFSETRVWIVFGIGLLARFYILSNNIGGYFSYDPSAQLKALKYVQVFVLLESLTSLSLVLYFVYFLKQGNRANWAKFIIMLGIELSTVFLMGFKGQVIFRIVYLAIAYAYFLKKFPWRLIILSIVLLVLIMPVNLLMRIVFTSGNSAIRSGQAITIVEGAVDIFNEVISGKTEYTFLSVPERFVRQSAQLENFSMAIQYVDHTNSSLNGAELLNFFYGFIPRAVWPSKPIASLGSWFYREVYGFENTRNAEAITVPGDLYLNLNWWGVLLGLFFYGSLLRIVYESAIEGETTVRMASLIPFIVIGLGIPRSEIGIYLNGLLRELFIYGFVLSFFLLPANKFVRSKHYAAPPVKITEKNSISK